MLEVAIENLQKTTDAGTLLVLESPQHQSSLVALSMEEAEVFLWKLKL